MFKAIKLQKFRGFNEVTISGLSGVNVITGLNGSGKTSILEATFLVCGAANAGLIASIYSFRGDHEYSPAIDRPFRSAFKDLDPSNTPIISAFTSLTIKSNKYQRELRIKPAFSVEKGTATTAQPSVLSGVTFEFTGPSGKRVAQWGWSTSSRGTEDSKEKKPTIRLGGAPVENPDLINAHFVSPYVRDIGPQNHSMLTKLVTERRINEVVDVLKIINPLLSNIVPLMENGEPVIYADIGGKSLLPLSLLGTGLSNCLHIVLPLIISKDNVILIDEFEDGLHHSLFKPMLKVVFDLARKNNHQIFLSTHSNEFLSHLVSLAREESLNEVSFFRLAKRGIQGQIPKFTLSEAHSLLESDLDLR